MPKEPKRNVTGVGGGDTLLQACSPGTPPEVLVLLTDHRSETVQSAALRNPALPGAVIERVLTAGLPPVVEMVRLGRRAFEGDALKLYWLLRNPALSEAHLTAVAAPVGAATRPEAGITRNDVLDAVLAHPNCARVWLDWGVNHADERLGVAIARNPQLPDDLAERLLRRGSAERRAVTLNLSVSADLLERMLVREWLPEVLSVLLPRLSSIARQTHANRLMGWSTTNQTDTIRGLVAQYSVEPAQVAALCNDDSEWVRVKAASNAVATDVDRVCVALQATGQQVWAPTEPTPRRAH